MGGWRTSETLGGLLNTDFWVPLTEFLIWWVYDGVWGFSNTFLNDGVLLVQGSHFERHISRPIIIIVSKDRIQTYVLFKVHGWFQCVAKFAKYWWYRAMQILEQVDGPFTILIFSRGCCPESFQERVSFWWLDGEASAFLVCAIQLEKH